MTPYRVQITRWIRQRRKRVVVGLFLAVVLLGRLAWFWYLSTPSRQITIGRETTYLDGPLDANGCVDYLTAVEQQAAEGTTPENNAVVLLWEAYGAKETTFPEWSEQFRRLGAPVPASSTVETIPLDLLVEASRRQRYYAPSIVRVDDQSPRHLGNVLLPLTQLQREGVGRLIGRAGQRLAAGDFEAAWSDALACHRLARLIAQDRFLINLIVAFVLERMALEFEDALIVSEQLTADRARSCIADLAALPPFRSVAETIDRHERLLMLDSAMVVARGNAMNIGPEEYLELSLPGAIDWNIVLRAINDYYDRYVAALREPDQAVRNAQFAALAGERAKLSRHRMAFALQAYIGQREQASRDLAHAILGSSGEHLLTAHETEHVIAARASAVRVGFALAAWRIEYGEYPETLAPLVPNLLSEVPIDPQTGKLLLYRRTGTGFEIYREAPAPHDLILHIGEDEDE